jgi:hypothetical protein
MKKDSGLAKCPQSSRTNEPRFGFLYYSERETREEDDEVSGVHSALLEMSRAVVNVAELRWRAQHEHTSTTRSVERRHAKPHQRAFTNLHSVGVKVAQDGVVEHHHDLEDNHRSETHQNTTWRRVSPLHKPQEGRVGLHRG